LTKLNFKDDDEEQYLLLNFREKMAGENLHDGNKEGACELWLERVFLSRRQRISAVTVKRHSVFTPVPLRAEGNFRN
jgi:hypothetical protein